MSLSEDWIKAATGSKPEDVKQAFRDSIRHFVGTGELSTSDIGPEFLKEVNRVRKSAAVEMNPKMSRRDKLAEIGEPPSSLPSHARKK